MKQLVSIFTILSVLAYPTLPVLAAEVAYAPVRDAVNENVDEETQQDIEEKTNQVKDSTLDTRKEVILKVLNEAEEILQTAENQLNSSEYASEDTQSDGQQLIDDAQTQLSEIQDDVENADTSAELDAARADAVEWLKENKDLAKELAVDIYIDSLEAANEANVEVILVSKSLVPYFEAYKIDTTDYRALIKTAEASLDVAEADVATAVSERTQESLDTATRSSAQAAEDTAKVLEEADTLSQDME